MFDPDNILVSPNKFKKRWSLSNVLGYHIVLFYTYDTLRAKRVMKKSSEVLRRRATAETLQKREYYTRWVSDSHTLSNMHLTYLPPLSVSKWYRMHCITFFITVFVVICAYWELEAENHIFFFCRKLFNWFLDDFVTYSILIAELKYVRDNILNRWVYPE